MRQFTAEESEGYGEFLESIFEEVPQQQIVEKVLARFQNANLASESARKRIASEIEKELK